VFAILKPEPLFYYGKENIDTKCHRPNTLELMIEYTLISIILNKICEMTKKIVRISKR
jgi:hypothetical protein